MEALIIRTLVAFLALCSACLARLVNLVRCPPAQPAYAYAGNGLFTTDNVNKKTGGILHALRSARSSLSNMQVAWAPGRGVHTGAMWFPSLSTPLPTPKLLPGKKELDRQTVIQHASCEDEDEDDDNGFEMKSPKDQEGEQTYIESLESFDACKDRDRALRLKTRLQARNPGYRRFIDRAFDEVFGAHDTVLATGNSSRSNEEKVANRIYQEFVDAFASCVNWKTALPLKMALMSRHPGHRSPIGRAFREVFDAKTTA